MYYSEYETEPREKRMKRKWKGVKEVLQEAEQSSGEFQTRLKELGACAKDFKDLDDYAKIPPLRKKDIIKWRINSDTHIFRLTKFLCLRINT